MRRALGARKVDILRYFQIENLLIAGGRGGIGRAAGARPQPVADEPLRDDPHPVPYVVTGVLAMLAIGQAAVFVPARRASNVPPVVATRAA